MSVGSTAVARTRRCSRLACSAGLAAGCLLVLPGGEAAAGEVLRAALAVDATCRAKLFLAAVLPCAPGDEGAWLLLLRTGRHTLTPSSSASAQAACASLLASLGVAHLDLCLLDVSRAGASAEQPLPGSVAGAWRGLEALLASGSVRSLGLAHAGWRTLDALLGSCVSKPAVCLCELHPLLSQRKLCGTARRKGVAVAALLPAARACPELLQHPTVVGLAEAHGRTASQLVLRYNVQRGVPCLCMEPLSGADVDAAFSFQLTYPQKVNVDTLGDAGRRFLAPAGCSFAGGRVRARNLVIA